MNDGTVQIAPDSTGKLVDTSELERADGSLVERQRGSIGDPSLPEALAGVSLRGELAMEDRDSRDLLKAILVELQTITYYLKVGLNVSDISDDVRSSIASRQAISR